MGHRGGKFQISHPRGQFFYASPIGALLSCWDDKLRKCAVQSLCTRLRLIWMVAFAYFVQPLNLNFLSCTSSTPPLLLRKSAYFVLYSKLRALRNFFTFRKNSLWNARRSGSLQGFSFPCIHSIPKLTIVYLRAVILILQQFNFLHIFRPDLQAKP